jgi:group I intron endonuclease
MKRPRDCGIYKILNTANNKFYLGSAVNLKRRWYDHLWHLKRGTHSSRHLQSAWMKYGEDAFIFAVVERIAECDLLSREQHFLDLWKPYDHDIGYNMSKAAGSTLGIPCSPEKAEKIGNANRGKTRSEEHLEILRKYAGSVAFTPETGVKISEANIRRGSMTEEIWKKGVESRRGKPLSGKHSLALSKAHQANTENHKRLRALNEKVKGTSTKLSLDQIEEIQKRFAAGEHPDDLAKVFGVSNTTIRNWSVRKPRSPSA